MKKRNIVLWCILAVCLLAVIFFAVAILRELYIDGQSKTFYSDIIAETETRPRQPARTGDGSTGVDEEQAGYTYEWLPYVDFDELNKTYPGIVGWIRLDDTLLNYPVMQYTDNDFFISHLPDGTPHRSGSVFLDHRNESDFSDKSILIYGHQTRDQDMFSILKNYRDRNFYESNPVIHLHTPDKDYMIVIFAGHLAHSQRDHPPLHFENDEAFMDYIRYLEGASLFRSNVSVSAQDRIVSLCTCAYDFDEARLIITGILLEY